MRKIGRPSGWEFSLHVNCQHLYLNLLYQGKQEGLLYKAVDKIYHFTLIELVVCNFRRKSSNVQVV